MGKMTKPRPSILTKRRIYMKISFVYPRGGYIFYRDEEKKINIKLTGCIGNTVIFLTASVSDYNGRTVFEDDRTVTADAGGMAAAEYILPLEGLGYYSFRISAEACTEEKHTERDSFGGPDAEKTEEKPDISAGRAGKITGSTGIGVTTRHERSGFESVFGVSCNFWNPERDMPLYERVGVRFIRNPGKDTTIKFRRQLEECGMYSQVQLQGNDMFAPQRHAHYKRNTAYYYMKQYGDVSRLIEHGNEHWEERDLGALAEWVKSTGLARLEADPTAWHSGSGAAGVDKNKMQVLYEQGMYDYITFIALHAYSFPQRPEGGDSYWSTKRLADIADWMKRNNIDMPVCCTEQGYPAMYDQKKCESYSPGELVTLEAQCDYLVRSWLVFISYGVAKVLWFNGPWYDGFGIQEKDGPAPWPAMMALCQLIREVDGAEYIGDLEDTPGVYFKVFRQKDGSLTAAVWRPVYYSRSCEKEKNLALDLSGTEADGTVREKFSYTLKYTDSERLAVRDIMGNPIQSDGVIEIGESPVYISGISEEIVSRLHDKTVFKTKTVKPRPMPPKVILGIGDTKPFADAYTSSRFMPGETREYRVRVHNFSEEFLEDTAVLSAPDYITVSRAETGVRVPAGQTRDFTVKVTCSPAAPTGEARIYVSLKKTAAHKAFQAATVFSPLWFDEVQEPLRPGGVIKLNLKNGSSELKEYRLSFKRDGLRLAESEFTVRAAAGQTVTMPLEIAECGADSKPVLQAAVECDGRQAEYSPVIPLRFIGGENGQSIIIAGYDLMMTTGERYTGPELFGTGKTRRLDADARFTIDDRKLYCHFEIFDDTIVCTKNVRRNNIDSDGVWIRLYKSLDDTVPYRHFSIVPADQAGREEGVYVNEVSANVKFDYPYTDYDFGKLRAVSKIYDDRYTIDVEIDRGSIELWNGINELIMDLRVIDMNHDDWPRFYDTGKARYKILF